MLLKHTHRACADDGQRGEQEEQERQLREENKGLEEYIDEAKETLAELRRQVSTAQHCRLNESRAERAAWACARPRVDGSRLDLFGKKRGFRVQTCMRMRIISLRFR